MKKEEKMITLLDNNETYYGSREYVDKLRQKVKSLEDELKDYIHYNEICRTHNKVLQELLEEFGFHIDTEFMDQSVSLIIRKGDETICKNIRYIKEN